MIFYFLFRKRVEESIPWDNKNVYAQMFVSKINFMTGPKPGVWHNLCILISCAEKYQKIFMDSEEILHVAHAPCTNNNELMNRNILISGHKDNIKTFFGSFTDLKVWKKILSYNEITNYDKFDEGQIGDFLDWKTISLDITG